MLVSLAKVNHDFPRHSFKYQGYNPTMLAADGEVLKSRAGPDELLHCTVHIYYGSGQDTGPRKREIADIAEYFTARQKKDGETYILLGDFNILNPEDPTMKSPSRRPHENGSRS